MAAQRECVGGPYDGLMVDYVGPTMRVPIREEQRVSYTDPPDEIALPTEPKTGNYRELTPLQAGARHVGTPAYFWERHGGWGGWRRP
jgi:hypothetical protein